MQLFDMAGMSAQIKYFLNLKGVDVVSECFIPQKSTLNEFYEYYHCKTYPRFRSALFEAIKQSHKFNIIHIHSVSKVIPIFKTLGKKVILHCHGSDIMENKMKFLNKADHVIYNSKDMEQKLEHIENKTYLPNFIDTELFRPIKDGKGSLIIVSNNLDKKKTLENLPNDIVVYDLDKSPRIKYFNMSEFLNQYKTYFDQKVTSYGLYCKAFSLTGLQALACGLFVIHNGKLFNELPLEATPKYYICQLRRIYEQLV